VVNTTREDSFKGSRRVSVINFIHIPRTFLGLIVDVESMFQLFNVQPELIDPPYASPLKLTRGDVEFKNVTFGYSHENFVLRDVNFKVPAGHTVAIVSL